MRQLLIEELKRALELLEQDPPVRTPEEWRGNTFYTNNRDFAELDQLLHMTRRHSVAYIKQKRAEK